MTIMSGDDLEKEASKKAMDFVEDFIKKEGSKIPLSEVSSFESFRPTLEGLYACGYAEGYSDAIKRVMEDTGRPELPKGESGEGT